MDPRERYVYIYRVVSRYFPDISLTVLDAEYSSFFRVKNVTPLFLNVVYDGIVLYDRHGRLKNFLSRVRRELEEKGVRRRKIGRYYYWELPKPGEKVKLEV